MPQLPRPNSPDNLSLISLIHTALAEQIQDVIHAHEYATAEMLARFLGRPVGTVRNTLTSLVRARKLITLPSGSKAPAYAIRPPRKRDPYIGHTIGIVWGDLALAYCEERCGFLVLPVEQEHKPPCIPDRMWRLKRPHDNVGVIFYREFQRTELSRRQLREKINPYLAISSESRRLLIETETFEMRNKFLNDLASFTMDPKWKDRIFVGCQKDYRHDLMKFVSPIWRNANNRQYDILGGWRWDQQ